MALFTPVSRIGPTINLCQQNPAQHVNQVTTDTDTSIVPEHLQLVFERGCKHLKGEQVEEFKKFILKNQNCFARPGEVGRTHLWIHKIKLKDEKPVREPPTSRRIPMFKRQAVEEEVKKLEERGLIENGFLIGQDDSVSGETSKIKRGRKPNRPKQAKQIPQSDTDLTLEVIRDKQESDSILKQILKYKIEGRKPDWGEISSESVHLKYWLARWESIDLKNGILCMYWDDDTKKGRWKICAPNSIEKTILWYLHDTKTAGHLGIKKTYEKAKLSPFYWRNMQESIKNYVNQCEICGERKNPPNKKRHCMKSYVVGDPFERIATDIAGPFPITDNKNRYILVVGDYFPKLTEAYAMPDIQAKTFANIIFRA
ncbi:Hypothetical predicted protein [Mytilus galloprovincialis]|uniref:Integrase zinc-binding domain-containing protein n=1 Tax=Mytilus galloprovincialis TaxID=29158 RepID=A0A8B6CXE4_MYTGA|nr:Hypothetical predicted protein [Mytilus galloprovincialis]